MNRQEVDLSSSIQMKHHYVKDFIMEQFNKIVDESMECSSKEKIGLCYYHFTTAIDTENIGRIFSSCKDFISRNYLMENSIL